eukprot:5309479-Alexandrium_andersonii.AAC.1
MLLYYTEASCFTQRDDPRGTPWTTCAQDAQAETTPAPSDALAERGKSPTAQMDEVAVPAASLEVPRFLF